jgi:hypothetical protein
MTNISLIYDTFADKFGERGNSRLSRLLKCIRLLLLLLLNNAPLRQLSESTERQIIPNSLKHSLFKIILLSVFITRSTAEQHFAQKIEVNVIRGCLTAVDRSPDNRLVEMEAARFVLVPSESQATVSETTFKFRRRVC